MICCSLLEGETISVKRSHLKEKKKKNYKSKSREEAIYTGSKVSPTHSHFGREPQQLKKRKCFGTLNKRKERKRSTHIDRAHWNALDFVEPETQKKNRAHGV